MKVPTAKQSRFLSYADLQAGPIVCTMDKVVEEKGLRNPFVLHFVHGQPKPLPLNWNNRRTIVAAFGDDSDMWHGRQIEVYYDPTVENFRDPSKPGGVRIRMPSQAPQPQPRPHTNGHPIPHSNGQAAQMTPEQAIAKCLELLLTAKSREFADEVLSRAVNKFQFTEDQECKLAEAHDAAMRRLGIDPTEGAIPF